MAEALQMQVYHPQQTQQAQVIVDGGQEGRDALGVEVPGHKPRDMGNNAVVGYLVDAELAGNFGLVSIFERVGKSAFLIEIGKGALDRSGHRGQVLGEFFVGLCDALLAGFNHAVDPSLESLNAFEIALEFAMLVHRA